MGRPTPEESSAGFADCQSRGPFKERHDMLARHRGKPAEEFIDRVTGLDIVEQGLYGHTRAREHWRPAALLYDLRALVFDRGILLRPSVPGVLLENGQLRGVFARHAPGFLGAGVG
jgi:hypothetical protein